MVISQSRRLRGFLSTNRAAGIWPPRFRVGCAHFFPAYLRCSSRAALSDTDAWASDSVQRLRRCGRGLVCISTRELRRGTMSVTPLRSLRVLWTQNSHSRSPTSNLQSPSITVLGSFIVPGKPFLHPFHSVFPLQDDSIKPTHHYRLSRRTFGPSRQCHCKAGTERPEDCRRAM